MNNKGPVGRLKRGWGNVHNDVLTIDQNKTQGGEEAHLEIPLHPKLHEIIEATPTVGVKTFQVTHFGKPYTALVSRIARRRRLP